MSRYRETSEINYWADEQNPLTRTRLFLESRGIWSQEQEDECRNVARAAVLDEIALIEKDHKAPAVNQVRSATVVM
jgi:2-oxoisovalerate dehydrogenase E1 component alpha subunit